MSNNIDERKLKLWSYLSILVLSISYFTWISNTRNEMLYCLFFFYTLFYVFILPLFSSFFYPSLFNIKYYLWSPGAYLTLIKNLWYNFCKSEREEKYFRTKIHFKNSIIDILEGLIYASVAASFACFANEIT